MTTKNFALLAGIFFMLVPLSFASVEELASSYSYDYNNGSVNITSFNDYLIDTNGNLAGDTLLFNLTANALNSAAFLAFIDLDNGEATLTNVLNKTLNQSENKVIINFSSALLAKNSFNYSVRIYDGDNLVYRKYNLTTNSYSNYEKGAGFISFSDQSVGNTRLRITINLNVTATSMENVTVFLGHNGTTISKTKELLLNPGTPALDFDLDNETIKKTHYNGKFLVDSIQIGNKIIGININTTNSYNYENFAQTSFIKRLSSEVIDIDQDNLSDYIRVNFTIDTKSSAIYTIKSKLYDYFDNHISDLEKNISLDPGINNVSINVSGRIVYGSYRDGPYKISHAELFIVNETQDFISKPYQTGDFFFYEFERPPLPDLTATIGVTNLTNQDSIQLNVTNKGNATAVNIFVDILDDVNLSQTFSIQSLNVNETTILELNNSNSNVSFYIATVDAQNIVDETDETNNIAQNTKTGVVSLKIDSISTMHSNETLKIFEFVILNDGDSAVTNIQWQFDTGNNHVINGTSNISSLASGEKAFVYLKYNYSDEGNYDVKANATGISSSTQVSSSLSSSIIIGDLAITSFDALNADATKAIFEMQAKNNLESNITDVNWSIVMGDGQTVKSANPFSYIKPNETVFIFAGYDYGTGGLFSLTASVANGIYSDSKNMNLDIKNIEALNLSLMNLSGTKGIFEFIIKNSLSANLTSVNWTFDTKNSRIINSTTNSTLKPDEQLFVYMGYNFTGPGTFNTNATAKNGTLSDSFNLTLAIA